MTVRPNVPVDAGVHKNSVVASTPASSESIVVIPIVVPSYSSETLNADALAAPSFAIVAVMVLCWLE